MSFLGDLADALREYSGYDALRETFTEGLKSVFEEAFSWIGIDGKTVVTVEKISTAIFEDNDDDLLQKAITRAALAHVTLDIPFTLSYDREVNSAQKRMREYFKYAENDRYIHSLPTIEISGGRLDAATVSSTLNTALGGTYIVVSYANEYVLADIYFKYHLQSAPFFYKPNTNTLTFRDSSGVEHDDYKFREVIYDSENRKHIIKISRLGIITDIVRTNYIRQRSLLVTYYETSGSPDDWFYWMYNHNNQTYPGLSTQLFIIDDIAMMPTAILRRDKVNVNADKTTKEYHSTKMLCQKLGLDINSIIENLNGDNSIDDIDDVYINFAMAPKDTHPLVSRLLYNSFYEIVVTQALTSTTNSFTMMFREQDVNNILAWTDHTYTEEIVGVVATVGEHVHSITARVEAIIGQGEADYGEILTPEVPSHFLLQYQKDATSYAQLDIENLSEMSDIEYGGFHNSAFSVIEDDKFTIPLSWVEIDKLSAKEQLEVYKYILRLDIFAINVTYLQWYETTAFQTLFKLVLQAIAVISLGSAKGITEVVYAVFVAYAVGEIAIYIAEQTGNPVLAAIVAFTAAVALSDPGQINFSELVNAEQLVALSTSFANNLTIAYDTVSQDIAKDILEMSELAEERLEEIDEAVSEDVIDVEFMAALTSFNTNIYESIQGQYEFSRVYDYDSVIKDFFDNRLLIGVV